MLKLERDHLAAELTAVDLLLRSLPADDHLGRMGFEARRDELQHQLEALTGAELHRAQVALYFGGNPVVGSLGIQAEFGASVVWTFQDLLSKVWGDLGDAQLQPMGPVRDKEASQLHITSVVHGSFGFVLEELEQAEPMFKTPLSQAVDRVGAYLESFAGENEAKFSQTIDAMNPRVFQSLRALFASLHKGKATFRVVEGDRDQKFDRVAVERAWGRAEASDISESEVHTQGKLLGVIPMKRRFELESDETGTVIEGRIGERFGTSYLERMSTEQFAGKHWRALLYKRTVTKVGRDPVDSYILLELQELP